VVAAIVVLLAEGRRPTTYPPGSPEAAMQGYLAAWEEGELETAYGYFSDAIKTSVTLEEYQNAARDFEDFEPGDEAVYIDAVEGSGDRISLHLTIEHFYGDGPGGETSRSTTSVRMVRQDDGWKIDEQLIGVEPGPFPFDERPF
jgi:hypothetical protein